MQFWGMTDPGCVRAQNQDSFQVEQLDRNTLLCVVCDGMGGAKSGNVASSLAVDVFTQEVKRTWSPDMDGERLDQMLSGAVKLANFTVYDQAQQFEEFAGMGTTLVAVLIHGKQASPYDLGNVGSLKDGQDQDTGQKPVFNAPGRSDNIKKQINLHDQRRSTDEGDIEHTKIAKGQEAGTLSCRTEGTNAEAQQKADQADEQRHTKSLEQTDPEIKNKMKIQASLDTVQGDPEDKDDQKTYQQPMDGC